jgi:transcriptional regulator with XRE-family HTH domain
MRRRLNRETAERARKFRVMLMQNNVNLCINATILTWARKRNGFSIEEPAEKAAISPYEIEMWEEGIEAPLYDRLEDIADCLKTPVAAFFFQNTRI